MTTFEKISKDDVMWLLYHESEFTIEFSGVTVDLKGAYKEVKETICEDITITKSIRTGLVLTVDEDVCMIRSPDEALQKLINLKIPDDGIDLIQFDVWNVDYYRYNSDKEDTLFYSDFRNARKKADFMEIDMNGLLKRYVPLADSIKLTILVFDPKGLSENYLKDKPDEVKRYTEKFEKLKNINEAPLEALTYLGIPRLIDSLKDAMFKIKSGNTYYYECNLYFRLEDDVISWMSTFKSDYEMGIFEDLCFFKKDKQLYDSVSHEHIRSDMIDPTMNHGDLKVIFL